MPVLLAIDCALERMTAAVVEGRAGAPALVLADRSLPVERGLDALLLPALAGALEAAGLGFAAVDAVAVTVGPGGFTGIRIGLAAARGLALALDRPVVGVTVFEALAEDLAPGLPLLLLIDSRRGDVFAEAWSAGAPEGPPRALAPAEALALAEGRLLAGTGVALLPGAPAAALLAPSPAAIAAVALRRLAGQIPALPPRPLYLRAPDATPAPPGRRPAAEGAGG